MIQESSEDGRKDLCPDFTEYWFIFILFFFPSLFVIAIFLIATSMYVGRGARKSEPDITLRRRLVRGTRMFLERQYWHFMQNYNTANPQAARLGGRPSQANDVRAFIRASLQTDLSRPVAGLESLRMTRDGVDEMVPVWAELYFLLRSGAPRNVRVT